MALSITPTRVSTLGRITVAMGFVDPDRQCWDMMDDRPDRMDIRMSPNIFKNNHDALRKHSDAEIEDAIIHCFREWFTFVILDHGQDEVFLGDDLAAMKTFLRQQLLTYVESDLISDMRYRLGATAQAWD